MTPTMKEMLRAAKNEYDYVLVDLPPILPVVDVKAAAHLFDAFVLVVEWGSTSTDEIVKAAGPVLKRRVMRAGRPQSPRRSSCLPSARHTRASRKCYAGLAVPATR